MKRALVLLALSVLLLAACGDDDGDALDGGSDSTEASSDDTGEQATTTPDDPGDPGDSGDESGGSAVDVVKASLLDAEDGIDMSEGDAQCSAEAIVDAIGEERAASIDWGAADAPFSAEESEAVVDAFGSCIPLDELLTSIILSDAQVADSSRACVEEGMSEDDARAFLSVAFTSESEGPDDALIEKIDTTLQECLTEEEYAGI